jgi:choline kinase
MFVVILAAGIGSRLGRTAEPKSLADVAGTPILLRQLALWSGLTPPPRVLVVVGYKKELIMEAAPSCAFVYNDEFADTNTAASLARALAFADGDDVLWANGDLVLDQTAVPLVQRAIEARRAFVGIRRGETGAEDMKYTTEAGLVTALSKTLVGAEGEAIGLNFVPAGLVPAIRDALAVTPPDQYYEAALVTAIDRGASFEPLDLTATRCIEVDFPDDLDAANRLYSAPPDRDAASGP